MEIKSSEAMNKEDRSTAAISPKLMEKISNKLCGLENGIVKIYIKTGYVIAIERSEREHFET